MTYLVTQAVNEVENLCYTIRDGSVFCWTNAPRALQS